MSRFMTCSAGSTAELSGGRPVVFELKTNEDHPRSVH